MAESRTSQSLSDYKVSTKGVAKYVRFGGTIYKIEDMNASEQEQLELNDDATYLEPQ